MTGVQTCALPIYGVAHTIPAGFALVVDNKTGMPKIVQVDVAAIMRSSALLAGFPELPNLDRIQDTINSQAGQQNANLGDEFKNLFGDGWASAVDVLTRPGAVPLIIPPPPPPPPPAPEPN